MDGLSLSDPNTQRFLVHMLAGAGRAIGQHQGVAESIGASTQDLIKAQNYAALLKSLRNPQTTNKLQTQPAGEGKGIKTGANKITIEGSELGEVGKVLSGLQMAQEGAAAPGGSGIDWTKSNLPNFLLAR